VHSRRLDRWLVRRALRKSGFSRSVLRCLGPDRSEFVAFHVSSQKRKKDKMKSFAKRRAGMIAAAVLSSVISFGIGAAWASQPQMEAALSALQSAKTELDHVTMNKDGHAAAARKLVSDAIAQVEEGIAFGKAHGL
jgi:hypothetical protein